MLLARFSSVYTDEGFEDFLREEGLPFELLDLRNLEGTSCYCDPEAEAEILARLPESLPKLRWIDSGDYHYMSCLLALCETAPFHLLLLDHHPDNQPPAFGGVLSCGSWVKDLQERSALLRSVLTIGPEGGPQRIPEGWLEERKGERVYVSLDKDILSRDHARTDWTQGTHGLDQVKAMLRQVWESGVEVVAVDVCGELDASKGAAPEDMRINLTTNIDLQKLISSYLN
ncbi:MAG: hypothetical protein II171_03725 [Bacteroidales bacterium]|nr:hypothetical protein [Bacteroidales bacterium]